MHFYAYFELSEFLFRVLTFLVAHAKFQFFGYPHKPDHENSTSWAKFKVEKQRNLNFK